MLFIFIACFRFREPVVGLGGVFRCRLQLLGLLLQHLRSVASWKELEPFSF